MKRPEGFDPAPPPAGNPRGGRPASRPDRAPRVPKTVKPSPAREREARPAPAQPERPPAARATPQGSPPRTRAPRPENGARPGDARRDARARRKAERAEIRRFTRRARNRRVVIAAIIGTVVTLAGLVLAAVYSPILALREVRVEGASRVDPTQLVAAIDDQLGTPLALLDVGRIESALGGFPLIRSYSTQIVPPDTLVVQVVERQPVGSIATPTGFDVVDPAGIVLQQATARVPGVPLIDLAGADASSPAFDAAVAVLLSLPPALLAQVDTITAHTQDDVSLVLAGVGQRVVWGSADDSARKAALLGALIAVTNPATPGEFDVSAPSNGVFRPA